MRINKYLSGMGVCSRREADRLLDAGRVRIGERVAIKGDRITQGEKVRVDDKLIGSLAELDKVVPVLIAVNKPRGIVCSCSDNDRAENIVDFINYPDRIYPIGRLDKDSEGLILMTNQGELVNAIMRAANCHEKEYNVWVDKPVDDDFIKNMSRGVYLRELGVRTRACRIYKTGTSSFNIVLTQGLNRQIRRMCEELGRKVLRLKRIRIINIELGKLKVGEYRMLEADQLRQLYSLLSQSKFAGRFRLN